MPKFGYNINKNEKNEEGRVYRNLNEYGTVEAEGLEGAIEKALVSFNTLPGEFAGISIYVVNEEDLAVVRA